MPTAPTLRSLAAEAGTSPMTVSLALRNHPRIPVATRERIQKLAKQRGYTPDPQIAALMQHLRMRRPARLQSVIVALTTTPGRRTNRYSEVIARSARERAAELGFGFDQISLGPYVDRAGSLNRVLRARGIDGVVLLPMIEPIELDELLDWRAMSVVATTHSVLSPRFHCVLPDGFSGTLTMCGKLRKLGFRRIGLVLSAGMDERSHHNITGAFLWQNTRMGIEPVSPFIVQTGNERGFNNWLKQERPDAIISEREDRAAFFEWMGIASGKGRSSFYYCGISVAANDRGAGMLQREDEIGRTAVELLAGMLQHGEKGIPEYPKVTLIPSAWNPAFL